MIDKRQVRRHFSCHASDYDHYARVQRKVVEKLVRLPQFLPLFQGRGLEVGCGTGMLTRQLLLQQPKLKLILTDIAHGMTRHINRMWPDFPICGADAAALPFVNESFDLVASSSVYQWLDDLPHGFSEISRVLRKDGLLLMALFGEKTLYELRQSYSSVLPAGKHSHVQSFPSIQSVRAALGPEIQSLLLHSEYEVEYHSQVSGLLRSLKKIGAQNSNQGKPSGLASRYVMQRMIDRYERIYGDKNGIPATYEVIYLLARKR